MDGPVQDAPPREARGCAYVVILLAVFGGGVLAASAARFIFGW
jgi:hypothetical protein